MSAKSQLDIHEELLEEYGVNRFHLMLALYAHTENCAEAEVVWDDERWEFCPVCGSKPDNGGRVLHNYYRQKDRLI